MSQNPDINRKNEETRRINSRPEKVRMARSYNQDCILAYALDILGERWTLLIARELLLGPRRFADLHTGLPGIGTNLLSKRLKELETQQLIEIDGTGPNRHQYRLTQMGEMLRPTIRSLMMWSIKYYLSQPEASESNEVSDLISSNNLNSDSVALAVELFAPFVEPYEHDYVAHLTVDGGQYTLYYMGHDLIARRGQDAPASASLEVSIEQAMNAFRGDISRKSLRASIVSSGREEVVNHIIDCFSREGKHYREKHADKLTA